MLLILTQHALTKKKKNRYNSLVPRFHDFLHFFPPKQDKVLTQMVERISVPVGFVSKPSVVRGGRAAMCVLRLASAKELQKEAETSNKNLKPDFETPTSPDTSSTEEPKDLKQQ